MSLLLVVFYNNTDITLNFVNTETSPNNQTVSPGALFSTDTHYNVPDNSWCPTYFTDHHMEIDKADGTPLFSFWDNDQGNYQLLYCTGIDWGYQTSGGNYTWLYTPMNTYNPEVNGQTIAIVVSGSGGTYSILSQQVNAGV